MNMRASAPTVTPYGMILSNCQSLSSPARKLA
jgi:hypothetical protein